MTHFFNRRDLWGNRYSLWIVLLMAFVAPLCWWSLKQLRLENDVEKWLPDNDVELRSLRWAHEQFPVEEQILLTWDGSSINDPRIGKLVEELAGTLDNHGAKRGGLPHVASVIEPLQALNVMQKNGIKPHEAVRRLEGTILGAGMLRLRLTESGRGSLRKTKRELQTAMQSKYHLDLAIRDASPDLTPLVSIPAAAAEEGGTVGEPSPPAILLPNGTIAEDALIDHDLQVAWKGMRIGSESTIAIANWLTQYVPERGDGKPLVESSFFTPGCPAAIAIGISEAGLADKAETVSAIRLACKRAGIPDDSLHMAGSAVSATELNEEVMKAAWDPSFPLVQIHRRSVILTSALVSALLAYALVRSIRLSSMVLFISIFTMVCSMSIIPITGGSMNMVLIVMPTLLVVLTMSGAIHVANYWKHAAYKDESTAISETVRTSWSPCFLASLTTAIGLISLCTSSLTPVRQFGIYAAVGTMFSLLMVLFGLPSLLQLWAGRPPKEHELDHAGWRTFGQFLTVRPGLQSLLAVAICIGCSIGLTRFRTETKVIRYFPNQARIAQDYWYIETHLAGVMPVETIVRFDQQAQKDTNFLERMELVRQIQEKMRIHPEISGSASLADFQPVGERPPEGAGFLQKSKYNKRASISQQRIRDGEVPAARSFYTVSEQGHDLTTAGDGKLNQPGDELWRVTAQVNVMTDNDFAVVMSDLHRITQDVLKLQPGSEHLITGTLPLFVKTQQAVLGSLISSFGLAFALILGVFIIMLRSVAAGLVAMIPNVAPITVVFGIMSWMGERIDIGSMITASIALGIAVDGTLHYLTWVQLAMKNGSTRHQAIVDALVHCGPAMWKTSAAVAIGLIVLVPAELLLISRFGSLMAAMIGVALLGDIVLLPQLLGGPLGRLFEPGKSTAVPAIVELDSSTSAGELEEVTAMNHDAVVPSPHIKPNDPASKKRRSSKRRERDAG